MFNFLQKITARSLVVLMLFSLFVTGVNAVNQATVSAIVGNVNAPATIAITAPAYLNDPGSTLFIGAGTNQTITFSVADGDSTDLYYTITPSVGTTTLEQGGPISPSFDRTFTYFAPASAPTPNEQTITIAINDGSNVSSKVIALYIW